MATLIGQRTRARRGMSRIRTNLPEPQIQEFIDSLTKANYSVSTIDNYTLILNTYIRWAKGRHLDVYAVTPVDIDNFIDYLRRNDFKTGSIKQYVSNIKAYYKWLVGRGRMGYIPANLVRIRMTDEEKAVTLSWLSSDDITRIREYMSSVMDNRVRWQRLRDELAVELLITTGARASEIATLLVSKIDIDGGVMRIYGKKNAQAQREKGGSGWRPVPIKGKVAELVQEWLAIRPMSRNEDCLFQENFTRKSIQYIVRKAGASLGLIDEDGNHWLSPHKFRHHFATDLYSRGVNLIEIASIMGDSPATISERYIHMEDATGFSEEALR